jgi:hypothetical protein
MPLHKLFLSIYKSNMLENSIFSLFKTKKKRKKLLLVFF